MRMKKRLAEPKKEQGVKFSPGTNKIIKETIRQIRIEITGALMMRMSGLRYGTMNTEQIAAIRQFKHQIASWHPWRT